MKTVLSIVLHSSKMHMHFILFDIAYWFYYASGHSQYYHLCTALLAQHFLKGQYYHESMSKKHDITINSKRFYLKKKCLSILYFHCLLVQKCDIVAKTLYHWPNECTIPISTVFYHTL